MPFNSLTNAGIFRLLPFFFFGKKKQVEKLDLPFKKKLLRFMKLVVLLLGVFSLFMSEVPRLPFFVKKKQQKNHDVLYRKSVTFCKNCRFFLLVFLQTLSEMSPLPFCCQKQLKKHDVPFKKPLRL